MSSLTITFFSLCLNPALVLTVGVCFTNCLILDYFCHLHRWLFRPSLKHCSMMIGLWIYYLSLVIILCTNVGIEAIYFEV